MRPSELMQYTPATAAVAAGPLLSSTTGVITLVIGGAATAAPSAGVAGGRVGIGDQRTDAKTFGRCSGGKTQLHQRTQIFGRSDKMITHALCVARRAHPAQRCVARATTCRLLQGTSHWNEKSSSYSRLQGSC